MFKRIVASLSILGITVSVLASIQAYAYGEVQQPVVRPPVYTAPVYQQPVAQAPKEEVKEEPKEEVKKEETPAIEEKQSYLGESTTTTPYPAGSSTYRQSCSATFSTERKISSVLDPLAGVEIIQLNFKKDIPQDCILDFYLIANKDLLGVLPEGSSLLNLQVDYTKTSKEDLDIITRFKIKTSHVEKYKEIKAYYFNSSNPGTEVKLKKISEIDGVTVFEASTSGYVQISVVGVGTPDVVEDEEEEKNNTFWMIVIGSILGFLFLVLLILLLRKKKNDIYEK